MLCGQLQAEESLVRMIGQSSWSGLAAILALGGIGLLYLMSQIGQLLKTDQLIALKSDLAGCSAPARSAICTVMVSPIPVYGI